MSEPSKYKSAQYIKYDRAYARGYTARISGVALCGCPYHVNDVGTVTERGGWLYGWYDANNGRKRQNITGRV